MENERHHHHPDLASCTDLASLVDLFAHAFAHRVSGGRRGREKFLKRIREKPGITQKELAEELGIQPASVSELLTKLENQELVRREKDEKDRRMIRVFPTEDCPAAPAGQSDPFQSLTAEEQETLMALLRKLLADWEVRYPHQGRRHHHHHRHKETEVPE